MNRRWEFCYKRPIANADWSRRSAESDIAMKMSNEELAGNREDVASWCKVDTRREK